MRCVIHVDSWSGRGLCIAPLALTAEITSTSSTAMASEKLDLFKFPRTRHLFDAGGSSVSRDDLVMDSGEEAVFYSSAGKRRQLVVMEEKVDGANLGISLGEDMKLRVQNRSHYVDSSTHRQFSTLDAWVEEHAGALYQVLGSGDSVLFGEWLYAKHSVHYTRLPGYFLAFDIYDRAEGKFLSCRDRNRRLEGSGIPVVRLIAETTLSGREDARRWLETASAYYDGPCEGVYLRIDSDMPGSEVTGAPPCCLHRGKLVRPDFLQGIEEQWTRRKFTKNVVTHSYDEPT